jgi:hypothetical protein
MRIYLVKHRHYALSSASITSAEYRQTGNSNSIYLHHFEAFRLRREAQDWIDERKGGPEYEIVPFDSVEKVKHDARRKEEWK